MQLHKINVIYIVIIGSKFQDLSLHTISFMANQIKNFGKVENLSFSTIFGHFFL